MIENENLMEYLSQIKKLVKEYPEIFQIIKIRVFLFNHDYQIILIIKEKKKLDK